MAQRVVFHVGLPKTGTTYLQSVLWNNRTRLAQQGVLFPGRSRRQHMRASMVVREHPKVAERGHDAPMTWADLLTEIAEWPGTALLTHEFFGGATAAQAARAIEDLRTTGGAQQVDLVVTARDVVTITTSYWQELSKHGFYEQSLEQFPKHRGPRSEWSLDVLDLESVLRRWSATLPAPDVHVLVVPGPEAPRTALLEEFCRLLGADPTGFSTEQAVENTSLGLPETTLVRRLAPRLTPLTRTAADRGDWVRAYLAHGKLGNRTSERFLPSPERVAALRATADASIDYVRAAGFTVHGDLERLRVPDEVPATRSEADVTDGELLELALDVIAATMTDVRDLTLENKRLREILTEAPRPAPGLRERVAGRLARLGGRPAGRPEERR